MTTAIIILVMLLTLAYFYLKCSIMSSFSTMMIAIFASILSLSFYEMLAGLFISRGYGVEWAHAGCFILIFILSFTLLRISRDLLIGGTTIDLGDPAKIIAAIVCGLLTGVLISGNILIAIGLIPVQSKYLDGRYDTNRGITVEGVEKSFLNTDGIVTGLYSLISRGSMKSSKSFAVLHADYLSQIHNNRAKVSEKVLAVTSKTSLKLPSGKNKNPVRLWNSPDNNKLTIIRIGIISKKIQSGGAGNPAKGNNIEFYPAQVRMICKSSSGSDALSGTGKVFLPVGLFHEGKLVDKKRDEILSFESREAENGVLWRDIVFNIPTNYTGVLLEFKQNALIELPAAVPYSEENEKNLGLIE
ncbi:MAG: hypothetical protein H8E62_05090 [Planctomycetes bacterium]|nr:hypothetical protein [Planctomycetota bacterium]